MQVRFDGGTPFDYVRQDGLCSVAKLPYLSVPLAVLPEDGARHPKLKPPHNQLPVAAVGGIAVPVGGGAVPADISRPQAKPRGLRAQASVHLRSEDVKRAPYIPRPYTSAFDAGHHT